MKGLLTIGLLLSFTFTHLGREDGLTLQHIFSICQGQDGAIWWSSKNNVERYNGRTVQPYWLGKDIPYNDLSGRTISLAQSPDGRLYAYDNKGKIFRYDLLQDDFIQTEDVSRLFGKDVILNHIYLDGDNLWLALNEGVYRLEDGHLTPVLEGHFTTCLAPFGKELLLCTVDGVYDVVGARLYPFNAISAFWDRSSGMLWLGTFQDGVKAVNSRGELHDLEGIPANPVRALASYSGDLLVGVDGFGVYCVRRGSYKAQKLFDANQGQLHGNGIYALQPDTWGNIIIGSYSGGIDIARPSNGIVNIPLSNDHVNCVAQLEDGTLALGTDDGVTLYNPTNGEHYRAAAGHVVLDICQDHDGLLLATFGDGVLRADKTGNKPLYTQGNGVLKSNHVYSLLRDREGHLWMGCLDGDLVEKTESDYRYYPVRNVQDIIQLPDGRIAVATASGVQLVVPGQREVEELNYFPENHDPATVNRYALNLFVYRDRSLYISTDGGGLYCYDLLDGHCTQLTFDDGLPGDSVCSTGADPAGRFWVATEYGLGKIQNGEIWSVNYENGLNREYIRGAMAFLKDGRILLGSSTGAVLLDPDTVGNADYRAPLRLRSLVFDAKSQDERLEKTRTLLEKAELNLKYRQNTFELYFESVNLRFSDDISYCYCLDDGPWSKPSSQSYIRLAGMEAGSHILQIASVSRSGGARLGLQQIQVNIGEPWWNSWWMWMVYMALLVGAALGGWKIYQLHIKYTRLIMENPALQSLDAAAPPEENQEAHDSTGGREFVDSATRVVMEHLSDPEFSIDDLCREMAMSRTYLYVRLRTFTGKSPNEFIRFIRLERAALLLRSGHPVADVSTMVGFDNPKYFSTVFKKYFEVSPSKYR